MRLPRFIFNPTVVGWIRLWQRERKENTRLRRELFGWQGKVLQLKGITPLFTPPPKPIESVPVPPVGLAAKRAQLAKEHNSIPSAEDILAAVNRTTSNGR